MCWQAAAALACRYFLGDTFVQRVIERRETLELKRVAAFTSFGLIIGGGPLYGLFTLAYPRVIRPAVAAATNNSRVAALAAFLAMDIGLFMPFCYFPIFYTVRESIYHPGELGDVLRAAATKWRDGVVSDTRAASLVMAPQDALLVFAVPPHLAVPFVSASGFIWVLALSIRRGEEEPPGGTLAQPTADVL